MPPPKEIWTQLLLVVQVSNRKNLKIFFVPDLPGIAGILNVAFVLFLLFRIGHSGYLSIMKFIVV